MRLSLVLAALLAVASILTLAAPQADLMGRTSGDDSMWRRFWRSMRRRGEDP